MGDGLTGYPSCEHPFWRKFCTGKASPGKAEYAHAIDRPGSVAGPEMVGPDPRMLEHAGAAIEMQVVAVLEAAAREEVGEIFRGVAAAVAGIAAGENGRAVEEVGVVLL